MACSREEIESKRLAALKKIRGRTASQTNTPPSFYKNTQNKPPNNFETAKQSNGSGPIHHQSSISQSKFQPYNRNSPQTPISTKNDTQTPARKIITGIMYLISEDRFEVKPSEFSDPLIAIFKMISSKAYDYNKRLWNFSIQHYNELQTKVVPLRPNIVLGSIPQYVFSVLKEPQKLYSPDLSRIDSTLKNKLMPFQLDGVCFGIHKNGRCLIADDMGLGKTFQALAIASYYRDDWPLLIATTSTMRETWKSKIHELLPSVTLPSIVCVNSGKEKQYLMENNAKVIIISYKMVTLCTDVLIEKHFGAVILDESHILKSYKAQSTECIMKITKHAKRVILLSGTPALSRPSELFTQLQIIEPKFFQGYVEFGKRYCDGKQTNFGWDMTGKSNVTELQILLQKKFLIRRTKEQVLKVLKEKTREAVILDSSLLAITEKTKEGLFQLANTYTKNKESDKHSALLTFFSESAKVKIPAVCKYIMEVIKEDEKFLVFAHHRNVIEAICNTLDECKVHYISIDGSTKMEHRSFLVDKFQVSDSCRCAVLSITAANAGITLTSAQLVLFAELHWNPGILNQAEARAHRIGQNRSVSVRYLLAKGTSDDFIWPMLQQKLNVLNSVGLTRDTFENATTSNQISDNPITKYLSQPEIKDLCISGTNIRKGLEKKQEDEGNSSNIEDIFKEDDENDDLLAALDF